MVSSSSSSSSSSSIGSSIDAASSDDEDHDEVSPLAAVISVGVGGDVGSNKKLVVGGIGTEPELQDRNVRFEKKEQHSHDANDQYNNNNNNNNNNGNMELQGNKNEREEETIVNGMKETKAANNITVVTANSTIQNNSSNNNNQNKNKSNQKNQKKKKRKRSTPEELEREVYDEQKARYDKLVYTATKQLHKQIKQTRTLLLQKAIRKQKNNPKNNNNTTPTTNNKNPVHALKGLDLAIATQQAVRQLGLYHCDPRYKMTASMKGDDDDAEEKDEQEKTAPASSKQETEEEDGTTTTAVVATAVVAITPSKVDDTLTPIPAPLESKDPAKILVDLILTHKKLTSVLIDWHDKVTDYRRWCMKLEQRYLPKRFDADDEFVQPSKRNKKNKKMNNPQRKTNINEGELQATVENEASLFCTLGGGEEAGGTGGGGKFAAYGPAAEMVVYDEDGNPRIHKKNRQGQRQRRAKAAAIAAKKQGKSKGAHHTQSLNWREPKPPPVYQDDDNHHEDNYHNHNYQKNDYNAYDHGRDRGRAGSRKELRKNQQHRSNGASASGFGTPFTNTTATTPERYHHSHSKPQQAHADNDNDKQHPSWIAKQAQSTGIVQFQGTKITF